MITLWRDIDEDGTQEECTSFEGRKLQISYDPCSGTCWGSVVELENRNDRVSSVKMSAGIDADAAFSLMRQLLTKIAEWQDEFESRRN